MKNEIFNQMKRYGWNIGDNTKEEFENTYSIHYDFIQNLYDFVADSDIDKPINLNHINKQMFEDMITFMSDFLRALNDRDDYVKKLERGLMSALDELKDNNKDMDYYDKLRELTDMQNFEALDFLDKFSEN